MMRSVNSTYSATRRVSRSAITDGPRGRRCVDTPILGTLRHSRTPPTTSPPIRINDLAGDGVGCLGGQVGSGWYGDAGGPVGVGGVQGLGLEQGLDQGIQPVPVGPQDLQGLIVALVEDAAGLGL